ncbi:lymphocyte cytosolic protein 2a isoform X2 [Etheostoma cragini]|uniref:lymphocyte cytosolic protein 2a isoform X2 n=1 Tax=Etheostoma cragini TaxID=417921 RepID=UPI00155F01BE|nr:lymphocyte cytosolic protein 2a isoform X2 [Etheostoma cragini]
MSSDQGPSRVEVTGWSPQQLADYLKRMGLSGCDKVVIKNSISGSRFVNLSDNDLQKFPKLQAPMISKISIEISRKEEKRGPFRKKPTPKYHEPEMAADVQGWAEDEFDDEEFEDDYESPFSGNEDESVGDYESPNEDPDVSSDYEPPPTEPPEDLPKKLCPTLPIGDSDYIDNHLSSRGPPPAVCPRPPVSTLSAPSPRMPGESSSSKRDPSPHSGARKFPPEPPKIFRSNKPGRDLGSSVSPARGPHRNTVATAGTHSWRPQTDAPDPPTWNKPPALPPSSISVSRSNSSARPPSANRFDGRREQIPDEAPKHNTLPLQSKGHLPRVGLPGAPSRQGDSSLPPGVPSTGSLPHKLKTAIAEQRGNFVGSDRQSFHPSPATTGHTQELDPRWYVGKVTRGQAERCLKQVRKDGTYLVRDSTRQLANQPFTLMVFYQDKVYNIQIRQQNQNFQLGTGLKAQETFPSVSGIIGHYSQSPLLLIDANNRSSSQQNQCLLSDPAGYHMTGEQWS